MTTGHVYAKFSLSLATKKVDLTSDTLKVMLLSAYTVGSTQASAQYLSDVLAVATETSGAGYTAGGVAVASPSFTGSGEVFTLDSATNPAWTAATFDAYYALLYDSTPSTNATRPVIGYYDFGGNIPATGGAYTLILNASGLLTLTAA
jgi:hypothetical protein